jgi:hypothetical protein
MANMRLSAVLVAVIGLVVAFFGVVCQPEVIAPGVTYQKIVQSQPVPLEIHEVVVDPHYASIEPVLAYDTYGSAETTSSMAQRKEASVAINGGFFKLSESAWREKFLMALDCCGYRHAHALPVYGLKINGEWLSLSIQVTGFFGWSDGGKNVVCGVMKTNWRLIIGEQPFVIDDINKIVFGGASLYTTHYGTTTPRRKNVVEVIVSGDRVGEIKWGGGTKIPADGYVYTCPTPTDLSSINVGDKTHIIRSYCTEDGLALGEDLNSSDNLIASTPLLLKDCEICPLIEQEQVSTFFIKRHPRTAIGLLSNGDWLLLVVDGRRKQSVGMSLKELAAYFKERGCVAALNLDGGGSSSMVLNGKMINAPSGREFSLIRRERPVADALIVVPRLSS